MKWITQHDLIYSIIRCLLRKKFRSLTGYIHGLNQDITITCWKDTNMPVQKTLSSVMVVYDHNQCWMSLSHKKDFCWFKVALYYRWRHMEAEDVLIDCAKMSLDTIEGMWEELRCPMKSPKTRHNRQSALSPLHILTPSLQGICLKHLKPFHPYRPH